MKGFEFSRCFGNENKEGKDKVLRERNRKESKELENKKRRKFED